MKVKWVKFKDLEGVECKDFDDIHPESLFMVHFNSQINIPLEDTIEEQTYTYYRPYIYEKIYDTYTGRFTGNYKKYYERTKSILHSFTKKIKVGNKYYNLIFNRSFSDIDFDNYILRNKIKKFID